MAKSEVHEVQESTLAELRAIVDGTPDMPGESVVRVRTKLGANADGALIKRVYIAEPRG